MDYTTALVLFSILTLAMLSLEIFYTYGTQGFGFGFSANRNPQAEYSRLGLRIKRAYQNQIESAAYGVPVLAVAALTGLENANAETAAQYFIMGRAAFAVLYYSGIPFIRVPAFLASTLSTLFIAYTLYTSGLI